MKIKRMLAAILSLIMLVSVIAPATVSAAGTVRDEEKEVLNNAYCKGITPKAGRRPVMSVISVEPGKYTAELEYYYLDSEGCPHVEPDGTFEKGRQYICRVEFIAAEGYVFSRDTKFWFNGSEAKRWVGASTSLSKVTVEFSFVANDLTVYAVGNGEGAWLNGILWNPGAADNMMTEVSENVWEIEFEDVYAGFDYNVKFALNGGWDENFGMDDDLMGAAEIGTQYEAFFDGANIFFDVEDDESAVKLRLDLSGVYDNLLNGAKFTVLVNDETAPDTVVSEIRVNNFSKPNVNDVPHDYLNVTVPRGRGYEIKNASWWDAATGIRLDDDQKFVAGHEYYIEVKVALTEGYSFGENVKYFINGTAEFVDAEYCEHSADEATVYSINMQPTDSGVSTIFFINLLGYKQPELGGKAADYLHITVPENCGYEIKECHWMDCSADDYLEPEDTFLSGHSYCILVELDTLEGYVFADEVDFLINGSAEDVDTEYSYSLEYYAKVYSKSILLWDENVKAINAVNLQGFKEPKAGDKAADYLDITVPEDCGYEIDSLSWVDLTADKDIAPEDVFIEGHNCCLRVILNALEGYSFSEDMSCLINGSTENVKIFLREDEGSKVTVYSINVIPSAGGLPGDVDGNGIVDNADLVLLARYVVNLVRSLPCPENAYMNSDRLIDNVDLVMLARKIVGLA